MKRISLTSSAVALVLAVTGALGIQVDSLELHYPLDARRAAIVYGNSIEHSDSLVLKIDSELVLLRSQGFDSIVNIPFVFPWAAGEIILQVDEPDQNAFVSKSLDKWRQLAEAYDLEIKKVESSYIWHDFTRTLSITSRVPFNSYLLAQEFVGMEHVKDVRALQPFEGLHHYYQLWARAWSGSTAHYYFKTDACPEVYFRYDHFEVTTETVQCLGTHMECRSDIKSAMGIMVESKLWQAFIDDAEAGRPAWVDTARMELGKILRFADWNQFRWTRK